MSGECDTCKTHYRWCRCIYHNPEGTIMIKFNEEKPKMDTIKQLENKIAAIKNSIDELKRMEKEAYKLHFLVDSIADEIDMDLAGGTMEQKLMEVRAEYAKALGH